MVDKVFGSPGNPMSRDELVGKYRGCASRVSPEESLEKSIEILESLEKQAKVADLVKTVTV
ncbi:hypothetical protein IVB16_32085 [Bradyrhizobium sp. 183]|uniref:hypothetical protein n=1 Tax=unclassified Bradyrhizobium TaxID=2631580 RepID=UPI0020637B97|nr:MULTISPECIES: hypothetical protein [unclassified Bradyrhizobium]UPJ79338.1 hypothetical protein IVB17_32085 [Bradyrhizobium sp. 184]UPJ87132.1 hypothetical protein IVB16_32085 [Bradyrhizobium sp. 183]